MGLFFVSLYNVLMTAPQSEVRSIDFSEEEKQERLFEDMKARIKEAYPKYPPLEIHHVKGVKILTVSPGDYELSNQVAEHFQKNKQRLKSQTDLEVTREFANSFPSTEVMHSSFSAFGKFFINTRSNCLIDLTARLYFDHLGQGVDVLLLPLPVEFDNTDPRAYSEFANVVFSGIWHFFEDDSPPTMTDTPEKPRRFRLFKKALSTFTGS
jgi:hypothetical protein